MSSDEVIDPATSLTNRRWQVFQFLAPILGVILVIGTIALVTLHTYHTTREGTIVLSRSLLRTQQHYITQEVSNYLAPATSSSFVARDLLNKESIEQNTERFMSLGRAVLKSVPQVDSFFLADDSGRVWMISRHDENYDELSLNKRDGKKFFDHKITDAEGRFLDKSSASAGDYDPRGRLWYKGAIQREKKTRKERLYWTDPYPYASTTQFIVTASTAFNSVDGHHYVFTINVSLNQLTHFVNSLKVGKSGQAVIVDLDGHVIAGHNMANMDQKGFDASNVLLDPVTQPVFTRALNVFKVRGDGAGLAQGHGKKYVTIASAMPLAKRSWVLLLNAPESDFASFTRDIQKQTIYFSLLIVGLAFLLALGLIYQGRKVEHLQKKIHLEHDEAKRENATLLRIANTPGLLNAQKEIPILSEALAQRSQSRRVSLWRLLPDKKRLLCEDMFDSSRNVHAAGIEINKASHAKLFEALSESHLVNIENASQDPRFNMFYQYVMKTINSRRLLFWPVMEQHRPVGALMIEDPNRVDGLDRIVALASSVLAVRFAQQQKIENSTEEHTVFHHSVDENKKRELRQIQGFLVNPLGEKKVVPERGLYPNIPLMVVEFFGAYTTQQEMVEKTLKLVDELSQQVQTIAREIGLFSVQVSGSRIILLGSCSQDFDHENALRLAQASIKIREVCLIALAKINTRLSFRIGLDIGAVMASYLGKDPDVFNIWGEGLSIAELLARNSPDDGQIQVSEKAYQELRNYFLFRVRGEFYLPGTGVTKSYILAGQR